MGACTEATLAPHAATAAHRQPLTEPRRRHRPSPADGRSATQRPTQRCTRGVGKLGGSTRGAEHDSISVLSISVLLLLDGVRAGDEVFCSTPIYLVDGEERTSMR